MFSVNAFVNVFVKSHGHSVEHNDMSITSNSLSMFSQYVNNPLYFVLHPMNSFDLPVSLAHRQIMAITKQKTKARLCKTANYI